MPATSTELVPRPEPVPTTPGPMPTIVTSARATCRASASAPGTDTASRSPPNACPAVMVVCDEAAARACAATRSDSTIGRAAPSVIT